LVFGVLRVDGFPVSEAEVIFAGDGFTGLGKDFVSLDDEGVPHVVKKFDRFSGVGWGEFLWDIVSWAKDSFGIPLSDSFNVGGKVVRGSTGDGLG
jgi:hypothetical protein